MPELCYTATQVKIVRASIIAMMSVSLFQTLTIRRLAKELTTGRTQFNKLHEATEYLLEIINENDIELTEFDLIALTAISEDK